MTTIWNNTPKRSASTIGRNYNVSGLLYDVSGVLYQGSYGTTVWTFTNKSS